MGEDDEPESVALILELMNLDKSSDLVDVVERRNHVAIVIFVLFQENSCVWMPETHLRTRPELLLISNGC